VGTLAVEYLLNRVITPPPHNDPIPGGYAAAQKLPLVRRQTASVGALHLNP
jgi:hypothetical protein